MLAGESTNYYDILEAFENQRDSIEADTAEDGEAAQFRRFDWFWASRVNNGVEEDAGELDNYILKFSQYFDNDICTQNSNPDGWESIGPASYPEQWMGAVTAILADPDEQPLMTIYAGTRSSGLWKTSDGGQHWACITDSRRMPILGVHAIAKSGNRIWIGTGALWRQNYSAGIFWTDDEGATWNHVQEIPSVASTGLVRSIEVYGNDTYIAQETRLWRSTNGGAFVDITPTGLTQQNRFTRLVRFVPQTGDPVLVATAMDPGTEGNGAQIYASENNGDDWTLLSELIDLEDVNWPLGVGFGLIWNNSHPMEHWHGWDNNQQDEWQYDGPYAQGGFNGVLRYLPTQIGNDDPVVFYGNDPDLAECGDLTHWDTPYKVRVDFRKDACANFEVYLAGELNEQDEVILENAQLIYSTYGYAGATDNSTVPLQEFDANNNHGSRFIVVVGHYPGLPSPCSAYEGILIDKIEFFTDAIEVSNVDVVQSSGSEYFGYHIAAKGVGGPMQIFSGTSIADFANTGTINSGDLTEAFTAGPNYQNFKMAMSGRVFTAGVCGVFCAENDGAGNYTEIQTGWEVFGAQSLCGNNGSSTDAHRLHCDFRCLQVLEVSPGQQRLLVGNDGGVGYLAQDGLWHNLNGEGLAIHESYG